MTYLPWGMLVVALGLLFYAWRVLAADARSGYDVTMGGAMYFSSIWTLGSVLASIGLVMVAGLTWWWGLVFFVSLAVVKGLVYRVAVALNLGAEAPPLPKNGFKEFIRKTEARPPAEPGE
jgi:hypothetical protein